MRVVRLCLASACTLLVSMLLFGLHVAAEDEAPEPDTKVIQALMAKREKVTLPVAGSFRVTYLVDGVLDYRATYAGRFARRDDLWIALIQDQVCSVYGSARGPGDTRNPDKQTPRRLVILETAGELLQLTRLGESDDWRGTLRAAGGSGVHPLPTSLGLYLGDMQNLPFSAFLQRPSMRVLGYEAIAGTRCLKVVAGVNSSSSTNIRTPIVLWLSPEHGYFPLQWGIYTPSEGDSQQGGPPLALEEGVFRPKFLTTVQRLHAAGRVWFPVAAENRTFRGGAEHLIRYEVDPSTLRFGAQIPDSAWHLPGGVAGATVRDDLRRTNRSIGEPPFQLAQTELQGSALLAREVFQEDAGTRHAKLSSFWVLLGLTLLGLLLLLASVRWARRKRS